MDGGDCGYGGVANDLVRGGDAGEGGRTKRVGSER